MSEILKHFLTAPRSYSPRYIRETLVLFISTRSGDPQLWEKDLNSGEETQLTFGKERVFDPRVDKEGRRLLFSMDAGGNENAQIYMLKEGDRQPQNLTRRENVRHMLGGIKGDRLVFADNERDARSFDISVMDLNTGVKKTILKNEDHYNWPSSLSPDGRYLLYNKLKGVSDNAMWMADLESGQATRVAPDEAISTENKSCWLSDSSGFYLVTDRAGEFASLAYYETGSGNFTFVKQFGWDVEGVAVTEDGKYLALVLNEDGYSSLLVYERESMKEVRLPALPKGVMASANSMDTLGHKLLFSISLPDAPENIYELDIDNRSIRQVTGNRVEQVKKEEMATPRLIRFASFDRQRVPFFLYVPQGKAEKNLPLMIDIHGGPEGQATPAFKPFLQYLLKEGIAVAAPNIRGSTGYGKTYTHLDDAEKRLDSVLDIEELVKFVIAEGIADEKRIGVMGSSYGGFMALSCVSRLPRLFACAVDTVGMFNLVTFLENTAPYRIAHRESEYGSLKGQRQMLYEVSPVSRVDDIVAPLMVIHGANDPRVPVSEAEQVVSRLKARGVTVDYLRYEDEGHGISKLKNKLDCYPRMAAFIRKHLRID